MEDASLEALQSEISRLTRELHNVTIELNRRSPGDSGAQVDRSSASNKKSSDEDVDANFLRADETTPVASPATFSSNSTAKDEPRSDNIHSILLLADSALPLGSFAFSSGLESFLAHAPKPLHTRPTTLSRFLELSLCSLTDTTLPYVIGGWHRPGELDDLDNDLDASLMCVVARRASVQQGKALLAVWERSFCQNGQINLAHHEHNRHRRLARNALRTLSKAIKLRTGSDAPSFDSALQPNGHLPPVFGAVCAALGIPLEQCLYVYLLNHAKTVISAAIRASVLGPYAAQAVLASDTLQSRIRSLVDANLTGEGFERGPSLKVARRDTSETGQSVPALDLWQGRHEIIYSRIFNS